MSELPQTDEVSGLVISSITVRSENIQKEDKKEKEKEKEPAVKKPRAKAKPRKKKKKKPPVISPTQKRLSEIGDTIPQVEKRSNQDTLTDYYIELTPASIRFSRKLFPLAKRSNYVERQVITQWSYKSRANMLKRLLSLDYTPLFGSEKQIPVMITLTYPGDWQTVATDGKAAKRHIALLKKRYESKFKKPLIGVWKLEFQRRGAPHTHILSSITMDLGHFQLWLSKTWAEIVAHPDENEREKHLRAGTQVKAWPDYYKETPHSISHYFGKHSSANKGGVKEYQNRAPDLWIEAGSIGRFWGYWGLVPATATALVSKEDALFMQRTLRRWHKAKREFKKVRVQRSKKIDGVIYYRMASRRVLRLSHQGGFISVPDGMAETLLAALKAHKGTPVENASETVSREPQMPNKSNSEPSSDTQVEEIQATPEKRVSLGARFKATVKRFFAPLMRIFSFKVRRDKTE